MPEEATEPPKKRAKIVSACAECRRKKTKCNGEQPCRNCQKSAVHCIYPSLQQDDKRNGPTRAALESIEERLKNIEDMLRAVLSNQHTIDPTFQRLPSIHNLSASSAYDNNNSSSSNNNSNDNNDNNNKYIAEGVRVKGGSSGKLRELQKANKKTDCKAKLKATCLKSDPNSVETVHIGVHNHEIGGAEDLKYAPLSKEKKEIIMHRLRDGYSKRDCRITIQKGFHKLTRDFLMLPEDSNSQVLHRDKIVHQYEVYNSGIMHTIVARHPTIGTGCPVAYMFTEDHSMAAVSVFLSFVKNDIGVITLEKITINVSTTEHAAITTVHSEAAVQWCLFHVSRAWMGKIRELIKLESSALNNQVHRAIIADLTALMWEKPISVLVDDVEPDYIDSICKITLNVDRMGLEERRRANATGATLGRCL
ncbi:hypothetical protein CU097_008221 [Rhizopus azygosporus]|uniref:Zn(2)-C6 fungal-type domain-containing protein n=1 Tax=Rhizopus azygosporus TaxID=86630 RepID=A0A367JKQ2_RHIAZ|nr:hypothetical protein CU097_008221 [Rhizopus azygosporus]